MDLAQSLYHDSFYDLLIAAMYYLYAVIYVLVVDAVKQANRSPCSKDSHCFKPNLSVSSGNTEAASQGFMPCLLILCCLMWCEL